MSDQVVGSVTPLGSKYKWQIKNFSSIQVQTGVAIYSPVFRSPDSSKNKWRLQLFPNGEKADIDNYIAIYLQYLGKIKLSANFSVNIVNDTNDEIFKHPSLLSYKFEYDKAKAGWSTFVNKATILDSSYRALTDDTLSLSCSVFPVTVTSLDNEQIEEENSRKLSYLESLLDSGEFSDVTFVVQRREIHLHKAILASLSPVFEAMFRNEMREKEKNSVSIADTKYDVMKELFRYCYASKVNNIEDIAADLFIAADKYAMMGLKVICENSLRASLNADNGLKILQLATLYDANNLKHAALDFVLHNLKDFVGTTEFKLLGHECKDQLFKAMAEKEKHK